MKDVATAEILQDDWLDGPNMGGINPEYAMYDFEPPEVIS